MKTIFRRSVTTALSVLLTAGTIGTVVVASNVVSASPGGASTAPPWEPDANSVGGLVFYNASGAVITGGQITDSPIAAYVAGTLERRRHQRIDDVSQWLSAVSGSVPARRHPGRDRPEWRPHHSEP